MIILKIIIQEGNVSHNAKAIENIVKPFDNIICVHGFDFVPHEEKYFADFRLHPNDEGFDYYFNALYNSVRRQLEEEYE